MLVCNIIRNSNVSSTYTILCIKSDKNYIGEISRSIKKFIYEHFRDFKIGV